MFYQNKTYRWAIIILLLCHTAAVAQHYKKVGRNTSSTGYMEFDSSGTYNLETDTDYKWCYFYAKSNGNPWFYYDGFNGEIRSEKSNKKITNGTVRKGRLNPILQLTDSTYLVYHYFADRIGIEDTGYVVKAGKELEKVTTSIPFRAKGQDMFVISRISKYKYLMVTSDLVGGESWSKCYIHIIDKEGVRLTDSIAIDTTFFTQPIQWSLPGLRTYNFFGDMVLNNNASKLYLRIGARGRYIKFPVNKQFLEADGTVEIDIDTDGKVTSDMKKLRYNEKYDMSLDKDANLREGVGLYTVSPNNKVLYYGVFSYQEGYTGYDSAKLFRLDLESLNHYPIFEKYDIDNISSVSGKSPYGDVYQTIVYRDVSSADEGRVILNSNEASSDVISANIPPLAGSDYLYLNYRNPYDYMKLYHTIDYDCSATVRFQNKTDRSAGMDSFTWYFTREDGSMDTLTGFEPSVTYTKSGDYFYKVLGMSQEGREYGEWFIDTLKIRIPEKPIAAFTAQDTVVCAYSQAKFINQSTTDTINATNGEKWVWTFGDGETETVTRAASDPSTPLRMTHVYTTPGTYTVSLFYSNGFCDSTLTKNQYIKVVDAPAPGFSIDNNRGCSPFTVNVTDTVTKNTVKKKIIYGDGAIDSFFANSLPPWGRAGVGAVPHEYTQPGTYWLVQRLYGFTGCVTQLDSVQIFVTPGITDNDTIHALQGSYTQHPSAEGALIIHSDGREEWRSNRDDSREPIELTWSGHPAAVKYSLSRNGTQLAEVDTPFFNYTDSVDRPQPFTYSIVAVDSCGTASASGRQISPMYLTGRASADNSIAVITFSPYTEQLREQEYVVFTEENRDWTTLNSLGPNTSYTDEEFLVTQSDPSTPLRMTSLEKCYQVATRYGELSNILCLPYKPVIFIPTAFSPNADGLNDVYRPITFGIEHYEVKIYNRYGQKITQFDQTSNGWDASDAAMGAYMVTIRAKGTDNEWYNEKSTVTVVR